MIQALDDEKNLTPGFAFDYKDDGLLEQYKLCRKNPNQISMAYLRVPGSSQSGKPQGNPKACDLFFTIAFEPNKLEAREIRQVSHQLENLPNSLKLKN